MHYEVAHITYCDYYVFYVNLYLKGAYLQEFIRREKEKCYTYNNTLMQKCNISRTTVREGEEAHDGLQVIKSAFCINYSGNALKPS